MVKIIDMFKKLKSDYEARQKKIDDILDNTNKVLVTHTKATKEMEKTIKEITEFVVKISVDYDKIKEELYILKKNPWLRLFGIK